MKGEVELSDHEELFFAMEETLKDLDNEGHEVIKLLKLILGLVFIPILFIAAFPRLFSRKEPEEELEVD